MGKRVLKSKLFTYAKDPTFFERSDPSVTSFLKSKQDLTSINTWICQLPIANWPGVVYELQLYDLHSMKKCGMEAEPVSTAIGEIGEFDLREAWGRFSTSAVLKLE